MQITGASARNRQGRWPRMPARTRGACSRSRRSTTGLRLTRNVGEVQWSRRATTPSQPSPNSLLQSKRHWIGFSLGRAHDNPRAGERGANRARLRRSGPRSISCTRAPPRPIEDGLFIARARRRGPSRPLHPGFYGKVWPVNHNRQQRSRHCDRAIAGELTDQLDR